jgi:hypothetical protein
VENDFTTYSVSQTTIPDGYSKIYGDSMVSVVETNTCEDCSPISVLTVHNIQQSVQITDIENLITVARPDLNRTQFELYRDNVEVGVFSGVQGTVAITGEITRPDRGVLPLAFLATNNTLNQAPVTESFNFEIAASPSLSGEEIIDLFEVPTYPGPIAEFAPFIIYAVPALVIPYEGSANNFVLTPVIDKIYPGLTLLLNQSSFVESNFASVRQVQMTIDVEASLVAFSFGISNSAPPGTPEPPLDVPALFLDVGFVGSEDFSDPITFGSSPAVDVIVNKTIDGFDKLPDGCADFRVLLFDEDAGEWKFVEQLRNPKFDTEAQCGFTLHPEHFSKFAVGGVKGATVSTEDPPDENENDDRNRSRRGGSSSTTVRQLQSEDVVTSVQTQSGSITVHFENIRPESGQLKVNTDELSKFESLFDDRVFLTDNKEHGIIELSGLTYSTAGEVYDIDASRVRYVGLVEVLVPYDEDTVLAHGLESDVRFLHYNMLKGQWEDRTKDVNPEENFVTGSLETLSPVVAAIVLKSGQPALDIIRDPSIRIQLDQFSFDILAAGQLSISNSLHNAHDKEQDYVMIVQVLDESGIVQLIDWQIGLLKPNASSLVTMGLDKMEKGAYAVQIFLITDFQDPWLLSEPVKQWLQV